MTLTSVIPKPSTVLLKSWRVLVMSSFATGLALMAAWAHPTLLRFDRPISEALRDSELDEFYRFVTDFGATEIGIPISIVFAFALWKRCRPLAISYPATVVIGQVVNVILKTIVDRPRPEDPVTGTALASFPSGHTIQVTLLLGLLPPALYVLSHRTWVFWATTGTVTGMIFVTGLSRVGLGAHWPTDVVGGVLVGISLLLASEAVLTTTWARRHCLECALHLAHVPEFDDLDNDVHVDDEHHGLHDGVPHDHYRKRSVSGRHRRLERDDDLVGLPDE